MVNFGLLSELNVKLKHLYSTRSPIDTDSTPAHHKGLLQSLVEPTGEGADQKADALRSPILQVGDKRPLELLHSKDSAVVTQPGNLVVRSKENRKDLSSPAAVVQNAGRVPSDRDTFSRNATPSVGPPSRVKSGTQRSVSFSVQDASPVRVKLSTVEDKADTHKPPSWDIMRTDSLCSMVLTSPVDLRDEQDNMVAHTADFFGAVDDGWFEEETWRDRYDDLEFVKPAATLESLVIINRDNTEEAEAVLKLVHEFSDVFAVEVQSEPALVAPFVLDVDTAEWERIGKKTGPRPTGG